MSVMAVFQAAILNHEATLRQKNRKKKEAWITDDGGVLVLSLDCLLLKFFYVRDK